MYDEGGGGLSRKIKFDLWWPWKLNQGRLDFVGFVSCKGTDLVYMLLLNTNRKPYMISQNL